MADLTLKQGDTYPPVTVSLSLSDGTPPPSEDIESVNMKMSRVLSNGETVFVLNKATEQIEEGVYRYQWEEGETDTPGYYLLEWIVTYIDQTVQSFPGDKFNSIFIGERLPAA